MKKVLLILIPIFVLINYSIAQQNNKTLIGFYNLENYYDESIDEITIYKKIKRSSYRDMHKWADTDIEHVGFQFEAVTVPRNLSPVIV